MRRVMLLFTLGLGFAWWFVADAESPGERLESPIGDPEPEVDTSTARRAASPPLVETSPEVPVATRAPATMEDSGPVRVRFRLSGFVRLLGTRAPVAGAIVSVHVVSQQTDAGVANLPRTATDAEGRFSFESLSGVAGNPVAIQVSHEVCIQAKSSGFTGGRRIWRIPVSGSLDAVEILMIPPLDLGGRVEDEAGRALAGVDVTASRSNAPAFARVQTDAEGRFRLSGCRPQSRYELVFEHRAGLRKAAHLLSLENESITDLELRLPAGCGLQGRLVDPAAVPLAGVEVAYRHDERWDPRTGPSLFRYVDQGRTDADGRFELLGLPPGSGHLELVDCESHVISDGDAHFSLVRSECAERELQLIPLLAIAGRIVPVNKQGYLVTAIGERGVDDGGATNTDAEGRFVLTGLRAGTYTLIFEAKPGFGREVAGPTPITQNHVAAGRRDLVITFAR